jgi:hypothetical protein
VPLCRRKFPAGNKAHNRAVPSYQNYVSVAGPSDRYYSANEKHGPAAITQINFWSQTAKPWQDPDTVDARQRENEDESTCVKIVGKRSIVIA